VAGAAQAWIKYPDINGKMDLGARWYSTTWQSIPKQFIFMTFQLGGAAAYNPFGRRDHAADRSTCRLTGCQNDLVDFQE